MSDASLPGERRCGEWQGRADRARGRRAGQLLLSARPRPRARRRARRRPAPPLRAQLAASRAALVSAGAAASHLGAASRLLVLAALAALTALAALAALAAPVGAGIRFSRGEASRLPAAPPAARGAGLAARAAFVRLHQTSVPAVRAAADSMTADPTTSRRRDFVYLKDPALQPARAVHISIHLMPRRCSELMSSLIVVINLYRR